MLLYVAFNLLGVFLISLAHTECFIAKNNQFIEKWMASRTVNIEWYLKHFL